MPTNSRPNSSVSLKHEMIRQDIDEKWKRTMMTPTGVKIIRIQPSLNYESLHKYQNRTEKIESPPNSTSTPVRGSTSRARTAVSRNSTRSGSVASYSSQGSKTAGAQPGQMIEKPPGPVRPVSSRSESRSTTFNSRCRPCQPTHLYMKDDLRRVAKLNRPTSHVHSCSQTSYEQPPKQPRSPRRFDGTVVNLPKFVQKNEFLTHEDLSMGQKQYIWGIARIYSMSNLRNLKQRQYQSLLDYDFHRNMQDSKLKEHERMKELREYQRYTSFIKRYEQRIPRAQKSDSTTPCKEVSHIHRHVVKGWTTNPQSDEAYRPSRRRTESYDEDESESENSKISDEDVAGHYRLVITKTPKTDDKETEMVEEEHPKNDEEQHENIVNEEQEDNRNPYEKQEMLEESNFL